MIKNFKCVACEDKLHLVEQFPFGEPFLFLLSGSMNYYVWLFMQNQSGVCDAYADKE